MTKSFWDFFERGFEFILRQTIFSGMVTKLVLVPAKTDLVKIEKNIKKCLIRIDVTSNRKIILILLVEMIVLYVGFTIVKVLKPSFKHIFSSA